MVTRPGARLVIGSKGEILPSGLLAAGCRSWAAGKEHQFSIANSKINPLICAIQDTWSIDLGIWDEDNPRGHISSKSMLYPQRHAYLSWANHHTPQECVTLQQINLKLKSIKTNFIAGVAAEGLLSFFFQAILMGLRTAALALPGHMAYGETCSGGSRSCFGVGNGIKCPSTQIGWGSKTVVIWDTHVSLNLHSNDMN